MIIFNNLLDKNLLFSTINQEEIFDKYLGQIDKIGQGLIFNTIRGETKPSVSYKYFGDILMAKDYADWEFYGDCVDWAKLYYKYVLGIAYTDFEILDQILKDFDKDSTNMSAITYSFSRIKSEKINYSNIKIEARIKDDQLVYSMQDKKYWMRFGISTDLLPSFGVISCKKVWITDHNNKVEFFNNTKSTKDLIFGYRYGDGLYKIYQPLADPKIKWRSNIPALSMLDNINLNTEVKTTHIFYDNDFKSKDNPGQKSAARFVEKFGLKNVAIPKKYKSTDIAEFRENYGKEKTDQFLKEKFGNPENVLILTKSRKDRMVLFTHGYQSYCLQSEGILPDTLLH